VTGQLKDLSLSQSVGGKYLSISSTPTHSTGIHYVQLSTNLNGNQQPGGNKRKGHGKNRRVGQIIINSKIILIMRNRKIMLVREIKNGER
jgi:hypothetical protein